MTDETDEQEESVTETWNMSCPNCGRDDRIIVLASAWVQLTADGTEEPRCGYGGEEWDEHSPCRCLACEFESEVTEFDVKEEAE